MNIPKAIQIFLEPHVGSTNAMPAAELLAEIRSLGFIVTEPQLRETIRQMRKVGHLICSDAGGYFLPRDKAEAFAFTDRLREPARDLLHTARVLRGAARNAFAVPRAVQTELPLEMPLEGARR